MEHQGAQDFMSFISWHPDDLTQSKLCSTFTINEHGEAECLKNNQVKQLVGLLTYIHHLINQDDKDEHNPDIFSPLDYDNWSKETALNLQTYLVRSLRIPPLQGMRSQHTNTPPQPSASLQLIAFKRASRERQLLILFSRMRRTSTALHIMAKSHECHEVLDPTFTPGETPEEKELFASKQAFMFSVFNSTLLTDMGKTILRRHLATTDAQAVWKELDEYMKTSSKGAAEKRRITQYVTNTVLHNNFKGTTQKLVLHFNEQFRQLDEICEPQ